MKRSSWLVVFFLQATVIFIEIPHDRSAFTQERKAPQTDKNDNPGTNDVTDKEDPHLWLEDVTGDK